MNIETAFRAHDILSSPVHFTRPQVGDPSPIWVRLEQNYIQTASAVYNHATKKSVRFPRCSLRSMLRWSK